MPRSKLSEHNRLLSKSMQHFNHGRNTYKSLCFCDVATGKPTALDYFELYKIEAIHKLKLKHVVITSVNRDICQTVALNIFIMLLLRLRKIQRQQ